jgi:hypothetical protein
MQRKGLLAGAGLLAFLLFWGGRQVVEARATVDFNRDVRPILNKNCATCHGGVRQQANLSLLFREDALKPAKSGKRAIVPGDVGASELMHRITHSDPHDRMPKGRAPLKPTEISTLRRWIAQGAPWEPHWSYVKPVAATLPPVTDANWPKNGIDRFVLARLDSEHLKPSPPAECSTMARRVSLDLIGLPPTPEQAEAACYDGEKGYDQLVDTLLASPHFGERWAAMWLDLARYADSKGYEADTYRTMWRYRDWVIKSFNDDLPFDQFTVQQLAGDLLPNASEEQRIATGFHRNTMTNTEGGTDDEEFRVAAVVDRVNTTWTVWQGTSIGCTQCHGHPYDPIRNEEYYRAFAIFNNTADRDLADDSPYLVKFTDQAKSRGQSLFDKTAKYRAQADSLVNLPNLVALRRTWETELKVPAISGKIPEHWQTEVARIVKVPEPKRDGAQNSLIRATYAEVSDDPRLVLLRKERDKVQKMIDTLKPIVAPVMQELPLDHRRKTYILERGNFLVRANEVQPGVPASIAPKLPSSGATRLGLAKWLVSRDNPLTARVIVNRFWEQLFGIGLVETTEDFGTQGMPPANQHLLDWLAVQFVEADGWRIKALLKQIVMSATYRQASIVTPALEGRDPQNRLLARGSRYRLNAEQIRDQALFVSGLLSNEMFGPSVMPPQPDGIWQRPYNGAKWMTTDKGRYRRALYTFWRRTAPYPSMVTFDSPSREFCVSRRVRTNTPLQALVTLNDPVFVEAAQALARRMLNGQPVKTDAASVDTYLQRGYRWALQRPPDAATLKALRTLYTDALAHYSRHTDEGDAMVGLKGKGPAEAALAIVANAILNLDAFVTKE